jgi:hypothetical protein
MGNRRGKTAVEPGKKVDITARLDRLEQEVKSLKERLADGTRSMLVPLATLDPAPYAPIGRLTALVLPDDDAYVASLIEANINASGETVPDAVENLKDMLILTFERLSAMPKGQLGRGPAQQLAVLRGMVRRKVRRAAHQ